MQLDSSTDRLASGYIGHRYRVRSLLGHGGMAHVYRVLDELSGQEVALKQWHGAPEQRSSTQSISQFEYEYITLAQLSHPCMIEVYDYGLGSSGPFFTMELLDGGDLREHAPLPWARACQLFHEICSSLALLHSRRLIHRDISPRNIRCTRRGGAKLIDFGAMLPMGLCQQVVGTPAFAAPEVVQGLPLDARVDLFSLGATLYFALTGKQPSSARDFADVSAAAQRKPVPPSRIVADIPKALDGLVLSMLDPNPALRPRSAFEVMQRLAVLGRVDEREPSSVAQAYLATPELIGRDAVLSRLRARCAEASAGEGGTVMIEGAAGMGRTRVLDVCALWAKTLGASVLKSRGSTGRGGERPLARQLAEQLVAALPFALLRKLRDNLSDFDALFEEDSQEHTEVYEQGQRSYRLRRPDSSRQDQGQDRRQEQAAIVRAILLASLDQPLVVAIDDASSSDGESLSVLAELSFDAAEHRLLLVVTRDPSEPDTHAYDDLVRERVECLSLEPLSATQTTQLLGSVFGDVPHVALLGDRVHAVSAGNPGAALEIAHWLVARGLVKYEAGIWALPSSLDAAELPTCAAEALRARRNALPPLARELATTQALALQDGFTRATYGVLCEQLAPLATEHQVDAAIDELLRQHVLEVDQDVYALVQRTWVPVLLEGCDEPTIRRGHEALAHHYARRRRGALHLVHHLLCAGATADGLDRMLEVLRAQGDELDFQLFRTYHISPNQIASILARCLSATATLQRPAHEEHLLRRWLTILSVLTQDEYFFLAAPLWRAQLERDSGLAVAPPSEHEAVPARVYSPLEALRNLGGYVSCALAIAARRMDPQLMASLPRLLEPFAGLAPEIRMIWQVAIASEQVLCRCQVEQARARLYTVYEELCAQDNAPHNAKLHHSAFIRTAIAYAIGACEVSLGIASAGRWADVLDADPLQSVNAMYMRRVLKLQRGDVEGAERYRRKAELLAMHASATQMFTSTIVMELVVHGISGDLLGLKQLSAHIAPLAQRNACWRPYAALACGYFERLRGNPTSALEAFEACLKDCAPNAEGHFTYAWLFAEAGRAEALIDLNEPALAASLARKALSRCRKCGVIALGQVLVRALGLAEARLGNRDSAAELLETCIEAARARGVSGLQLGSLLEARTYAAIEARDAAAIEHYARLTAAEYRYAQSSSLGARCERLLEAAAQLEANTPQPSAAAVESWSSWGASLQDSGSAKSERSHQLLLEITRVMAGAEAAEGRATRALRLLCETHGATAGHLFFADSTGVQLAASYRSQAAAAELTALTVQHLQADLQQRADVTRVEADSPPRLELDARTTWRDAQGRNFEPIVLHCSVAGEARCAGLAWVARQPVLQRSSRIAQLTGALCAYLIEQNETTGI